MIFGIYEETLGFVEDFIIKRSQPHVFLQGPPITGHARAFFFV